MRTEDNKRDEEISSLLEVEGEIVCLMRKLQSTEDLTYTEASAFFTDIHAHAAWTDLPPLAGLAETIWSSLSKGNNNLQMERNHRNEMRKNMFTYKFLLNRLMGDYQSEIDAAMAS